MQKGTCGRDHDKFAEIEVMDKFLVNVDSKYWIKKKRFVFQQWWSVFS